MNEHDADLCDDDAFNDAEAMACDEFEMFVDIRTDAMNFAIATATPEEQPQNVVFRAQVYADWIAGKLVIEHDYSSKPQSEPEGGENVVDLRRH